jgi:hypothetical protein
VSAPTVGPDGLVVSDLEARALAVARDVEQATRGLLRAGRAFPAAREGLRVGLGHDDAVAALRGVSNRPERVTEADLSLAVWTRLAAAS